MWSWITVFYFACTVFGFLVALVGLIVGELGGGAGHDVDVGGGHDLDIGHSHVVDVGNHGIGGGDMPGASVFNTLTITTFIGFFGIAGLVGVWVIKLGPLASVAFALPSSILMAALEFYLYVRLFVKAQGSSEATMADVLGCEASVITTIPKDRIGQITYVIKGSRFTAPAVSADGAEIPIGAKVTVVNIKGNALVVRPF